MGKRTDIDEFSVQHRGGKGVKCYKITEKTGDVVGAKLVHDDKEIMLITNEGIIIRLEINNISKLRRITSGVKLMNVDSENDIVVASISKVRDEDTKEDEEDTEKDTEDNGKDDIESATEKNAEDVVKWLQWAHGNRCFPNLRRAEGY